MSATTVYVSSRQAITAATVASHNNNNNNNNNHAASGMSGQPISVPPYACTRDDWHTVCYLSCMMYMDGHNH
jgi:hypothetical protein